MSHYNYRQIKHGASKHLRTICARVGHTHQRMCRELGDLSADVPDPAQAGLGGQREAGAPASDAAATAAAGPGAGGGGAMSAAEADVILTKHFGR